MSGTMSETPPGGPQGECEPLFATYRCRRHGLKRPKKVPEAFLLGHPQQQAYFIAHRAEHCMQVVPERSVQMAAPDPVVALHMPDRQLDRPPALEQFLQLRRLPPSDRVRSKAVLDAQVVAVDANSGLRVVHERTFPIQRRQGLGIVHHRSYRTTTDSAHAHPIVQNPLDQRSYGWAPNRAWVANNTYLLTAAGWPPSLRSRSGCARFCRLVHEAVHTCLARLQRPADGLLCTRTGHGTARTSRPQRSIPQPEVPQAAVEYARGPVDEPKYELFENPEPSRESCRSHRSAYVDEAVPVLLRDLGNRLLAFVRLKGQLRLEGPRVAPPGSFR